MRAEQPTVVRFVFLAALVVSASAPVASSADFPAVSTSTSSTSTTSTTMFSAVTAVLDVPPCSQPVTGGDLPKASDCLFILNVGVGIGLCVPACICDVNGDFSENASDALLCLKIAVGIDLPRQCPCPVSTTTTTLEPVVGACCVAGICSIGSRDSCSGAYLGDNEGPQCSLAQQLACSAGPTTTTQPPTSTTTTVPVTTTTLPPSGGVCCIEDTCQILDARDCRAGTIIGESDNTVCDADEIAACANRPKGACCFNSRLGRDCVIRFRDDCDGFFDEYLGDSEDSVCSPAEMAACTGSPTTTTSTTSTTVPNDGGACCTPARTCIVTSPEACTGTYIGDIGFPECTSGAARRCARGGGPSTTTTTMAGPTTTSTTVTSTTTSTLPAPTGACCVRRSCLIRTAAGCNDLSGTYLGDSNELLCTVDETTQCLDMTTTTTTTTTSSTTTSTTLPTSMGACCLRKGGCIVTSSDDCTGFYLGDNGFSECTPEALTRCERGGGGSTTTTTLPEATGSCCIPGACSITTPGNCPGVYLGDSGSVGFCSLAEELACSSAVTTTTTTSTTTTTLPAATGACCQRRGLGCAITTEADCVGTYLGDSDSVGACSPEEEAMCP